jgi:hypothetical protein
MTTFMLMVDVFLFFEQPFKQTFEQTFRERKEQMRIIPIDNLVDNLNPSTGRAMLRSEAIPGGSNI